MSFRLHSDHQTSCSTATASGAVQCLPNGLLPCHHKSSCALHVRAKLWDQIRLVTWLMPLLFSYASVSRCFAQPQSFRDGRPIEVSFSISTIKLLAQVQRRAQPCKSFQNGRLPCDHKTSCATALSSEAVESHQISHLSDASFTTSQTETALDKLISPSCDHKLLRNCMFEQSRGIKSEWSPD